MTYRRVIPRDLFNEANLLKCMGQLWIALDERMPAGMVGFEHDDDGPFLIEQDPSTGAIEVGNVRFWVQGKQVRLTRPLNSRMPWPLYAEPTNDGDWFDPVAVFDDDGTLSADFERLVGLQ